jgi:hypothetical protein
MNGCSGNGSAIGTNSTRDYPEQVVKPEVLNASKSEDTTVRKVRAPIHKRSDRCAVCNMRKKMKEPNDGNKSSMNE